MGRSGALSRAPEPRVPRLLRGFAGVLAGGLVALAAGLLVAGIVAGQRGMPGPGWLMIVAHLAVAVVAVLVQRRADRTRGVPAAGAALVVVGLTAAVLAAQWLV